MQKLAPGPLISSCLTQRHTHPNGSCSQLPQTLSSPCSSRRKTQTQGCLATWLPGPLSSHWAVQLTAYEPSHTDVLTPHSHLLMAPQEHHRAPWPRVQAPRPPYTHMQPAQSPSTHRSKASCSCSGAQWIKSRTVLQKHKYTQCSTRRPLANNLICKLYKTFLLCILILLKYASAFRLL